MIISIILMVLCRSVPSPESEGESSAGGPPPGPARGLQESGDRPQPPRRSGGPAQCAEGHEAHHPEGGAAAPRGRADQ